MIAKLNALKQTVYEGNKLRGFWEPGEINKGERVMLIITELAEAVEAHRKGKRFTGDVTDITCFNIKGAPPDGSIWLRAFEMDVKDTVEDEIADAVIRILDYCGGFDIEILERDYRGTSTGNFAHDVLLISNKCFIAMDSKIVDWGYTLSTIIKFCEWYNIDLMQHIEWKLKFNATRPFKHGKKY